MNNSLNRRFILYMLTSVLITIFCYDLTLADTITLEDGTILVGKVIKRDSQKIVFKNSYGVFTIKKRQIQKEYSTEDYKEDIEIHREMGMHVDEKTIKKNYLAGLDKEKEIKREREKEIEKRREIEKRKEMELEESDVKWNGGRISIIGTHFVTTGRLKDVLPSGSAALIAYDQGLDFISGGKRHLWMPGIRLEGGYLHYEKNPSKVTGITSSGGPIWLLPLFKNQWGRFVLSVLPGVTFLKIESENYRETSETFTLHSLLGYEYTIGIITFFIHGRYMFLYDKDVNLNGIGGAFGISFTLW